MSNRAKVCYPAGGVAALLVAFLLYEFYFRGPTQLPRSHVVTRNGLAYDGRAPRPFSGIVVETYPGGGRESAIAMRQGKVDGWSRGWFENGNLEVEEFFVDGVSQGVRHRWFESGQKRSEAQIDHGQVSGAYSEWYENGRRAVVMTLKQGKPDGPVESWHQSGALKFRGHLKLGAMLDQEFFPDSIVQAEPAGGKP